MTQDNMAKGNSKHITEAQNPFLWVQVAPKTSTENQEEDKSDAKEKENQKSRPIKSCTTKTRLQTQHWALWHPLRSSSTGPCTCAKQLLGAVKVFSRKDTNSSVECGMWVLAAYWETGLHVVETPRVHGMVKSCSW